MKTSIGYNEKYKPEQICSDKNCPYHSNVSIRGKTFVGTISSDSMTRSVKVEWDDVVKDPKYSRYFKTKSKVIAHNPECITAKKGDKVLIGETRPLSKTKHFAVLKVIKE